METNTSSPPILYETYKSRRHSRQVSNPLLTPSASPPPLSRPSSTATSPSLTPRHQYVPHSLNGQSPKSPPIPTISLDSVPLPSESPTPPDSPSSQVPSSGIPSPISESPISEVAAVVPVLNDQSSNGDVTVNISSAPSTSAPSALTSSHNAPKDSILASPRRSSTFRRLPLRNTRSPLPSSPLRPPGDPTPHSRSISTSSAPRLLSDPTRPILQRPTDSHSLAGSSNTSVFPSHSSPVGISKTLPPVPPPDFLHEPEPTYNRRHSSFTPTPDAYPKRTSSLAPKPTPNTNLVSPPQISAQSSFTSTSIMSSTPTPTPASTPIPLPVTALSSRTPAPYRPGFQPKGVYRPRTDEFTATRRSFLDVGRIERTKLERRLEKLIALHFPIGDPDSVQKGVADGGTKEKVGSRSRELRPSGVASNRRASSFFDFDFSELKNLDAGDLWRGVLMQTQGAKGDIRAAEQRITPWQDDSAVAKCPLCTASFHPLTNRKHHCRLCGKIICSLPVKHPQRPVLCSVLFIVDPKTRKIEEVGEGVDYGVKKRRTGSTGGVNGTKVEKGTGGEEEGAEEKFLKGVRICRDCRPVLLHQQYQQEVVHIPTFVKLYEAFTILEKEIEDSLPQFQELILSLTHENQPTKEASSARKRLLEAFAQYDALSKQIRKLPCPGGPASSQDRVQMAILSRANNFLQKHMFPLQSLPTPKTSTNSSTASSVPLDTGTASSFIDPDSEVAHALQPLLEQEALLESFVDEAMAHRKFEDAKTLKDNLKEIRVEVEKILANAEDGMHTTGSGGKANGKRRLGDGGR